MNGNHPDLGSKKLKLSARTLGTAANKVGLMRLLEGARDNAIRRRA